jgi:CheY-like chemotaxis protein
MKKVLIVDDSAFARATLRKLLQQAGYEVCEAGGGLEALELMTECRPDLVTMDLLMPGMEGEELLAHLLKLNPACPFVIISADIQTTTREALLAAGAAAFLNKPVREAELLALLEKLL